MVKLTTIGDLGIGIKVNTIKRSLTLIKLLKSTQTTLWLISTEGWRTILRKNLTALEGGQQGTRIRLSVPENFVENLPKASGRQR